jgi:hypothetical protein
VKNADHAYSTVGKFPKKDEVVSVSDEKDTREGSVF